MPRVTGIVALGIIVGFVVGATRALLFVFANRYLALGMYDIALFSLRSLVDRFTLIVPLLFLASLCVCAVSFRALPARVRPERNRIATCGVLLGVLVLAMWLLRDSEWYPSASSRRGIAANALVAILFASAALAALRRRSDPTSAARKGRGTRWLVGGAAAAVLLVVATNAASWWARAHTGARGPNVLLITVDTLRADHLGAYGYERDTSPHLDALAHEGVLFSQAISQWPKTTPSFASMMTGTYAHHHGLVRYTQQRLGDRFVVLAEVLRNAGYDTVGIVTNGNLSKAFNFDQGFRTYVEVWREFADERAEHVSDDAVSWLRRNAPGSRFLMWLHYSDPHAPYEPPPPYDGMYVGDQHYVGMRRAAVSADFDTDMGAIPGRSRLGTHDLVDYYVAQYDAEIRYTDENIGRVLAAVKSMGLDANTLIVLTADHGESLGDHDYYFEHGRLPYDDCLRVPLIVKIPGVTPTSRRVDDVVELNNLMPTVLDALGLPVPPEATGRSLLPLMAGRREGFPTQAFSEAGYQPDYQRIIRTNGWKLIYVPDDKDRRIMKGTEFELYDLAKDPGESTNLIATEPQVAGPLKDALLDWIARGGSPVPRPPQQIRVDERTTESLKALGYVQ